MTIPSERPLLYTYFRDTADLLLAKHERSKGQAASDNLGYNRELFCSDFLSRVLPPRLSLRRGEILDSHGHRTGQLEIVMIRDDCPALEFGGADTFLAEGVFGVVEVKSNLSRDKLQEALKTLKLVKALSISSFVGMSSGPVLHRPLRCVFAYEGATLDTLIDELSKPSNADVIDVLCILNRGALVSKELLLDWDSEDHFYVCPGKAAALAWLYFHLILYSTSFMGLVLDMSGYFEPISGWKDA